MLLRSARMYLFYGAHFAPRLAAHGPFGDLLPIRADDTRIRQFGHGQPVRPAYTPPFYTQHYKTDHTPYLFSNQINPSCIPIMSYDLEQMPTFRGHSLTYNPVLSWELSIHKDSIGMITIIIDFPGTISSEYLSRFHCGHLDHGLRMVPTAGIADLYRRHIGGTQIPSHIPIDVLASLIHKEWFRRAGRTPYSFPESFNRMQFPLTVVEIDDNGEESDPSASRWASVLSEVLWHPYCSRDAAPSALSTDAALGDTHFWQPFNGSFAIISYSGVVLARGFSQTRADADSPSSVVSERNVLHTVRTAARNYYFLRIIDDLIDDESFDVAEEIKLLRSAHSERDNILLQGLASKIIRINLEVSELLEEIENEDKLIDDEWHISLLQKIEDVLNVDGWATSINNRINILRNSLQALDAMENMVAVDIQRDIVRLGEDTQRLNRTVEYLAIAGTAFGLVEAVTSLTQNQNLRVSIIVLGLLMLTSAYIALRRRANSGPRTRNRPSGAPGALR